MARGYQRVKECGEAFSRLGGPPSRRAEGRCEPCDVGGGPSPDQLSPTSDDPILDRRFLLYDRSTAGIGGDTLDVARCRFLEESIWTEFPPAQLPTIRVARGSAADAPWTSAVMDVLYPAPDIEAWTDAGDRS